MRHCRVVAAALFVAIAAWAVGPVLRAQARERSMYVSVLDEAGAPVPDLGPADFVIREDNAAREVLRVASAREPMQIELLIDNSQAAREYIQNIRAALPAFVDALTEPNEAGVKNEVGIVAFGERPTILTPPTSDRAVLHKGIDRIFAQSGSGSYLLDAIIEVSKGFKKREATRPVIIAITTEGPEFSGRHFDLVLQPLKDSGAALHAIVVGPMSTDVGEDARNRNIVLDQGPAESGGRFEHILTSMALSAKLTPLATELTHQYKVTFARPQSLIPPERTTVSAARPGLTARGTLIKEPQGHP